MNSLFNRQILGTRASLPHVFLVNRFDYSGDQDLGSGSFDRDSWHLLSERKFTFLRFIVSKPQGVCNHDGLIAEGIGLEVKFQQTRI